MDLELSDTLSIDTEHQSSTLASGLGSYHEPSIAADDYLQFAHKPSADSGVGIPDFSLDDNNILLDPSVLVHQRNRQNSSGLPTPFSTWSNLSTQESFSHDHDIGTTGDTASILDLTPEATPAYHLDSDSDPGILLSSLQADLSRQLFRVKSLPWDIITVLGSSLCSKGIGNGQNYNPLATVLNRTEGFLEAIQMLRSTGETNHSSALSYELRDRSNSNSDHVLSTAHQLTLFSCYLQLLSIYEVILSRIVGIFLEKSEQNNPEERTLPGINFAGYLVQGGLLGRLLAQVVEYQLELIESSLGLPHQYCVSSRRQKPNFQHVNMGLLKGMQGSALLGVVMGGTLEDDEDSGSRVVNSVREELRRLHQAL